MASMIPLKPKGTFQGLMPDEQLGLSWYVLSGCTREDAFLKFVRPDFIGTKSQAALKAAVSQFFAMKDVKDYLEAYKRTIEELLAQKEKPKKDPASKGTIEERKSRALSKLVDFVLSEAEKIGDPLESDETRTDPKSIMEFANKIGLFDVEEKVAEEPRRYLPPTCVQSCRYRLFVEENCVDDCQYCKYRAYGEANGIHYKPEEQLDVPERPGTDIVEEEQASDSGT